MARIREFTWPDLDGSPDSAGFQARLFVDSEGRRAAIVWKPNPAGAGPSVIEAAGQQLLEHVKGLFEPAADRVILEHRPDSPLLNPNDIHREIDPSTGDPSIRIDTAALKTWSETD